MVAYVAMDNINRKYAAFLQRLKDVMTKSAPVSGLDYAASYFILLCAYSLSFWDGLHLLYMHRIENGGKAVMREVCSFA